MVANMMLLTNDLHKLVQFLIFPKGGGGRAHRSPPLRTPLGRLQCSFNQIVDMRVSGESSCALLTTEAMHSTGIHPSATNALVMMAQG